MPKKILYALFILLTIPGIVQGKLILADPANYLSFLPALAPGDTLLLEAGTYTRSLALNNINGAEGNPIVITGRGDATVLEGESCCNTIDITRCSYLIIERMKLDGLNLYIDAVKGAGTAGNWAHHITVAYLTIVNYGADQQNVGISTKCPAWNWVIRKNRILGAGTGMYLGNSDGTQPFVNGLIECNLVAGSVGYNVEIKHQFNGTRDAYPGTAVNGKTIIRRNVFTKDNGSSTGGNARPNLLVGGFPTAGWGAADYYEIYGNFFFNNPVEALFQGTGNIALYDNIFVNRFDPSGFRAAYITPQNGVSPQDIRVFHNTVWAANSSGGIRLYNPNSAYTQYCNANAVFASSSITNFPIALDNVTDTYLNAGLSVQSADTSLIKLDLYPRAGKLTGTVTPDTLFRSLTDRDRDFNFDPYDWSFRGAYAGSGKNNGWKLQLDTMPDIPASLPTRIHDREDVPSADVLQASPNPSSGEAVVSFSLERAQNVSLVITDVAGREILRLLEGSRLEAGEHRFSIPAARLGPGIYFCRLSTSAGGRTAKLAIVR